MTIRGIIRPEILNDKSVLQKSEKMTTDKIDESGAGAIPCRPCRDSGRPDGRQEDAGAASGISGSKGLAEDAASGTSGRIRSTDDTASGISRNTESAEDAASGDARKVLEREVPVYPGERVDDLQRAGLRIIQDPGRFCFGMDAVLLSAYVQMKKARRGLDLGTGNGIIPILLSDRTDCACLTGLEIQDASADLAERSTALNGLGERIHIVRGDIREADRIFAAASFDFITCNPPYRQAGSGRISGTPAGGPLKRIRTDQKTRGESGIENLDPRAIARHEILCTFEDVARAASVLLRPGGHFYLVHRPLRLAEIITGLCAHGLEPKRMRLVYPYADKAPNMVLLDCVRGGAPELRVEPPLIVYEKNGAYTPELLRIYYGN